MVRNPDVRAALGQTTDPNFRECVLSTRCGLSDPAYERLRRARERASSKPARGSGRLRRVLTSGRENAAA